jgi:hypothetical protein
VADWQTISSLATAGGTLVLAVATFTAVRSSNRSARIAEQALLAGLRPLLIPSLADDPVHKVLWRDRRGVRLAGGRAIADDVDGVIYLALAVRNAGSGIALLHGWYPIPAWGRDVQDAEAADEFRRLTIDLYVPAGGTGYWEGAIREPDDPVRAGILEKVRDREPFTVDVLYGDQEGGQRTISRFSIMPASDEGWYCQATRHWNVDRPAPR